MQQGECYDFDRREAALGCGGGIQRHAAHPPAFPFDILIVQSIRTLGTTFFGLPHVNMSGAVRFLH
jgi:hypothetical protein